MKAGDTFLVSLLADEHLWAIISDPEFDPARVLMVNFSSWTHYHDQACVLERGDHPFIRHRTCVNYPQARVASVAQLEHLRKRELLFPQAPLASGILQRIRAAVRDSRLKLEFIQILVEQDLIE